MTTIDSQHTDVYHVSANEFIEKLNELDREIRKKTENLTNRELIVSHPSWSYFAREYNFTQTPIEQNGKEIQANALANLIKEAKQKKIKAVFVQPQFNNKAAVIIARELGARLITLDPLVQDYIANLKQVTDKIVEGLSDG